MHTLFELCNDPGAMRDFYSGLVGLRETFHDAERGWLTYSAGSVQIVFTHPVNPVPELRSWSRSPAWDSGSVDASSWVFCVSRAELDALAERLRSARRTMEVRVSDGGELQDLFARDPMGRTIEFFCEPEPQTHRQVTPAGQQP